MLADYYLLIVLAALDELKSVCLCVSQSVSLSDNRVRR